MFLSKKIANLKNVLHSAAIFFSHRCQQCFPNLKDCQIVFKKIYTIFSPHLAHGFWNTIHHMAKLLEKICKGYKSMLHRKQKICWEFTGKSPNGKVVKSLYLKIAYMWTRPEGAYTLSPIFLYFWNGGIFPQKSNK